MDRLRVSLRSLFVVIVAVNVAACAAGTPRTLGEVTAYEVSLDAEGALTELSELVVPAEAEVSVRPLWWSGRLHTDPGTRSGIEVVARATRVDGSTLMWTLAGPRPIGRHRADGHFAESFEDEGTDTVRVRHLEAMDFFVAQRDSEASPGGATAVAEALHGGMPSIEQARRIEAAAGPQPVELARRLKIRHGPSEAAGIQLRRLVLVEAAAGGSPARAARILPDWSDGTAAVADEAGRPLPGLSALMVLVRVEVKDRRAPPEPKHRPKRHRDRDDERLRKAPLRLLAAFR